MPIAKSLAGDYLCNTGSSYRTIISRGLAFITCGTAAVVGVLCLKVVGALIRPSPLAPAYDPCLCAAIAVVLAGLWQLASPDPGYNGAHNPIAARAVLRGAVLVMGLCIVALLMTDAVTIVYSSPFVGPARIGLWIALLVGSVPLSLATAFVLRWIADRIPRPAWGRWVLICTWLLPLLTVLVLFAVVNATNGRTPPTMPRQPSTDRAAFAGLCVLVCAAAWASCWLVLSGMRRDIRRMNKSTASPSPPPPPPCKSTQSPQH
ncbi:MAG TPA: hypothetical protein VHN77_11905 [Phycisphaerales bacterium]|nr:hypothetical protein [Phycisphaerales bacterium]